jgi:AraC-like DNA-binding protein
MVYGDAVSVAARSATNLPAAAKVDVRGGSGVRGGSYRYDGVDLVTGWHAHEMHQIEYALEGIAEVESTTKHHLLPPHRAAWIPAGAIHRTTLKGVRSVAVFFEPAMISVPDDHVRIVAVTPLLREMMSYATRWPIDRERSDGLADAFFATLAGLLRDCLDDETPLHLPTSTDPLVAAIMRFTNEHLAEANARSVCAAVGLSERSLSRRFSAATDMTWRQYLLQCRLLRAMALLTEPGSTVTDVAIAVGFNSVSAFARAFRALNDETPTSYRARVCDAGPSARAAEAANAGGAAETTAPPPMEGQVS